MVIAEKEMFTTNEVAARLKFGRRTIYRLIRAGELKAIRIGRKAWRIEEEALQEFIDKNRTE